MPSISTAHARVRAVADVQCGLVTAAQLRELGVHSSTVSRWIAGYMLTRVVRGVHVYGGGRPDRQQRELAAQLYGGEGALLTGTAALRHHGIRAAGLQETADDQPDHPEPVHVLIPHDRHRTSTGYVVIERTHRMPRQAVERGPLDLAPVVRAASDAVHRWRNADDVLAVLSELVQRNLATLDELRVELAAGSRRGSAHYRAAMVVLADGVESAYEARLRKVTQSLGLAEVRWNRAIVSQTGEYVGNPDGWYDDVALALEVDSQKYHGFGKGLVRTTDRNARYARFGVAVYPVMPNLLRDDPDRCAREIRQAYQAAAARPRPAVHAVVVREVSAGRKGWRWGA
ncbi:MAG TPA: hypothetical protein VFN19_08530 [Candidatus Nanopelagicales bacterium]|nr:hypothetical protein [Candidatus Nanopelagicales bacterium]